MDILLDILLNGQTEIRCLQALNEYRKMSFEVKNAGFSSPTGANYDTLFHFQVWGPCLASNCILFQ